MSAPCTFKEGGGQSVDCAGYIAHRTCGWLVSRSFDSWLISKSSPVARCAAERRKAEECRDVRYKGQISVSDHATPVPPFSECQMLKAGEWWWRGWVRGPGVRGAERASEQIRARCLGVPRGGWNDERGGRHERRREACPVSREPCA